MGFIESVTEILFVLVHLNVSAMVQ